MQEKYYNVDKVSEMLDMHPKTIQRYIREGKLRATKVGKAWRISGHDLSVFMQENDQSDEATKKILEKSKEDRIMVSSVIDIDVVDMDEGMKIINTMTAALNSKLAEFGKSSMNAQFIEQENKVRMMLYGNIKFMESMVWYLSNYTNM